MSTQDQASSYLALLTPANNSGVLGLARITGNGNQVTVDVAAAGLTPGEAHPLHLHGLYDTGVERLALIADDSNRDGLVSAAEAAPVLGPDLLDLNTAGQAISQAVTTGSDPVADAAGNLRFSQTFTLDRGNPAQSHLLDDLTGRAVDLHGLAPTDGSYDLTLPAAQGLVVALDTSIPALNTLAQQSDAAFLDTATALLAREMPYMLNPEGTGPAAPEPANATDPGTDTFATLLLPSNGSGVLGGVVVRFDEAAGTVRVDMEAIGATPDQAHASHIHGFASGAPSLVPNIRLDVDGDHFVEDQEGETVVGPVILGLTRDGSVTDAVLIGNWPVADADGHISLHQTYQFDLADPAQQSLFYELEQRVAGREVQIHGLDVPAGEGDGTPYEVHGGGTYVPNLPVANGVLVPVTGTEADQALALVAALSPNAAAADHWLA